MGTGAVGTGDGPTGSHTVFLVQLVPLRFQVPQLSGQKSRPPAFPHDAIKAWVASGTAGLVHLAPAGLSWPSPTPVQIRPQDVPGTLLTKHGPQGTAQSPVRGRLPGTLRAPLCPSVPLCLHLPQEAEGLGRTLDLCLPTPPLYRLQGPGLAVYTHSPPRHSGSISGFSKPHAGLQCPVPLSGTHAYPHGCFCKHGDPNESPGLLMS